MKAARCARAFGAAVATSGRARSSLTVSATLWPSRIVSTRVRGAKAFGAPTPVARCTAVSSRRLVPRS